MRWFTKPLICALTLSVLAGCDPTPLVVCLPVKTYPPEFSQRLANELDAMPSDSATVEAIGDYIGLRDQLKACKP